MPRWETLTTTSTTSEMTVASTAPTARTGDLAVSPSALGDEDEDDVDNVTIDGGIDSTNGDDGGSRGITCRVGRLREGRPLPPASS